MQILAKKQQKSSGGRGYTNNVLHEYHGVREPNGRSDIVEHVSEAVGDAPTGIHGSRLPMMQRAFATLILSR